MAVLDGHTILQVIPDLAAGGAERTTVEVAQAVVLEGGRALVASRGGRLETALKTVGGVLKRMNAGTKNPVSVWYNSFRLSDMIRREKVSLIHARSRAPAWSAYWAARRAGIPFVTTYHGAYTAKTGLKRWYNSVMARGDIVIANSEWIAEHVRREHGLSPERVVTIPRGVDLGRFTREHVSDDRRASAEKLFGRKEGQDFTFIMPARMTRWKGHAVALTAFASLPDALRQRAMLVLVGDAQGRDSYVGELVSLAESANIDQNVRILGHLDDVPAALACCDVMLAPSTEPEAFGRTAAEGAAMGLPVIASDHGGARETVIDGLTGLRVAPGDGLALAGAMETLMRMPPQARQRMGEAGRAHVKQRFSTESLQAATIAVYQSLLEGKNEGQH